MTESAPPTFASKWDRVTYLLAEFKWPLLICLAAGGLWAMWARPELPSPPNWTLAFAGSAALISFPSFFLAKWIVNWFDEANMVSVGVASPGQNLIYEKYMVPSEVWENREREGPAAMRPDDGVDFIVTDWEYLEDVGTLRVRGCDREDMDPSEAWADASRVELWFDHYHDLRRAYSALKAELQDKGTEIHDATIMKMMEVREGAELAPDVEVTSLIDELEEEAEGIPERPEPMDDFAPLDDKADGETDEGGEPADD